MGGGGESSNLEQTPTWVVGLVCLVIVTISLGFERLLDLLGEKILNGKKRRYLREALNKVKAELMLLGFISLLLAVFESRLSELCIHERYALKWLPCKKEQDPSLNSESHFLLSAIRGRRLLAEDLQPFQQCPAGNVPLLSLKAIHDLHIFIFVLAMVFMIMNVITVLLGRIKIRQWRRWERAIQKKLDEDNARRENENKLTYVTNNAFIKKHVYDTDNYFLTWTISFFKHLYWSLDAADYEVLRGSFIQAHCNGYKKFDFHKFILRAYESDFTEVVGVSWYLWIFMIAFLLLNVAGWHFYFWLAFLPLAMVLLVGTKLVYVISELAKEIKDKNTVVVGEVEVRPSDEHFWCNTPKYFLILIHITLFQISFELAIFFWVWVLFGLNSCQNGTLWYIIPRLAIVVFVEIICSYTTLPLYAIVTKMGSSLDKAIFDEPVQASLHRWAKNARKKNKSQDGGESSTKGSGVDFSQIDIDIETEMQRRELEGSSSNEHDQIQPATYR